MVNICVIFRGPRGEADLFHPLLFLVCSRALFRSRTCLTVFLPLLNLHYIFFTIFFSSFLNQFHNYSLIMGIILLFFFYWDVNVVIVIVTPLSNRIFVLQPQCKRFSIYLTSCYIHVGATNNLQVQTVLSVIYYFTNSSCNIADIIWIIIYVRKDKKLIHA